MKKRRPITVYGQREKPAASTLRYPWQDPDRQYRHVDKRVRRGQQIPEAMQRPAVPPNPKAKRFKS